MDIYNCLCECDLACVQLYPLAVVMRDTLSSSVLCHPLLVALSEVGLMFAVYFTIYVSNDAWVV